MRTKICSRCKAEKPISEFLENERYADGYFCWCKECQHNYYRNVDLPRNRERRREYNKQWYQENKEEKSQYGKKWRRENKEKIHQRYIDNREKIREQHKEYYENNKEKHLEKTRDWAKNNRDKMNEYSKKYHEKNKDEINKRHRQRKRENYKEWLKIIEEKFGELKCSKCGYNRCFAALDFHSDEDHIRLSKLMQLKPTPERTTELDKGILLCANCHRELHNGVLDISEVN